LKVANAPSVLLISWEKFVNQKRSRLLCYALVISISLVLMGFLAVGVRAFESAGVSSFLLLAALTIFALTPVFYFVWHPIGRAELSQMVFEGSPREMWMGHDRRKPGLNGREKMAITIERRGKQRSISLKARQQ
jgi:hypothetical protein